VLAVHAREAAAAGLAEDVIAALTQGRPAEPGDPRQRAVADMMAALTADQTPSAPVFDAAVGVLGHEGVAEVLALAGYFTAVALAMKMYAVTPPGDTRRSLPRTAPPAGCYRGRRSATPSAFGRRLRGRYATRGTGYSDTCLISATRRKSCAFP
jgi:hypothetical protein